MTGDDIDRLAADGELVGYFGYGSLVNRATHRTAILAAFPARLSGWRRTWKHRPADASGFGGVGPAVLTAERHAGTAIDGMLVIDRLAHLPVVDERERLYIRRDINAADMAFAGLAPPAGIPLFIYEAAYEEIGEGPASPILRSYLDAVMQGFLREFGEAGLDRFLKETAGFGRVIHEDRHQPVYPRAVELLESETALCDAALARIFAGGDGTRD